MYCAAPVPTCLGADARERERGAGRPEHQGSAGVRAEGTERD